MEITDQTGENIVLKAVPQRIVSLVPSQTELLAELGLDDRVVGVTRFCVAPPDWRRRKAVVGGTKTVDVDKVRALRPDLVLANREENVREQVAALRRSAPVWVSRVGHLEAALEMILAVGRVTGTEAKAKQLADAAGHGLSALEPLDPPVPALYLVWRNPYMTVGGDTFIHDMMRRCGLRNVCAGRTRYPGLDPGEMQALKPALVLLPSEPFPFGPGHAAEVRALLPDAQVAMVQGEYFSWYGSRLVRAAGYLRSWMAGLAMRK